MSKETAPPKESDAAQAVRSQLREHLQAECNQARGSNAAQRNMTLS
jgi:hypothetical protein